MATPAEAITKLVRERPAMAHDLYSALAADSVAERAASTALHRLVRSGKVRRLNLRLRHGRAIVFTPEAPADATFVRRLSDTGFGGTPGPARILRALASSSGVMSAADAAKLAGLEVGLDPTISLKEAHDLMRDLEQLGIVSSIGPLGAQLLWRANDVLLRDAGVLTGPPRPHGHYGTVSHLLRYTVARQVADWLFQNGWTSKLGTLCADKENPVRSGAGMAFDVVAFSHLPAIRATADKARVILGDVNVRAFAEVDAEAYLHRFGRARARFKHDPLCFVLARSFQADAHARLKEEGILPWTHSQFFNEKVAEAIRATLELAQAFARGTELDPSAFEAALAGAKDYGQIFGSIRGCLFEIIVGQLMRVMGGTNVRFGIRVGDDNLDVDVLATFGNGLARVVECKGQHREKPVEYDEVEKHFARRLPAARDYLLKPGFLPVRRFEGVIAATSPVQFESNTGARVAEPRDDTTHAIWDRPEILRLLREHDLAKCAEVIEQHF